MATRVQAPAAPMSPLILRRRGSHTLEFKRQSSGSLEERLCAAAQTPPHSAPTTPRSTMGSPLTTHAAPVSTAPAPRRAVRRSMGGGDLAAGPRRRISLSEVEKLPWLCCMTPAILVFGITGIVTLSALFAPRLFFWLTAYLTSFSLAWIVMATLFALRAHSHIQEATKVDWQQRLEEVQQVDPDGSGVLHIVILPNYKENEKMLKDTLENLGRSPLASTRMRVVLGMEAREGPSGHEKANRLIAETSHLFADIFATYHPEGLPGELPGKSSNTQWAYREACRHLGPLLMGYDLSRVFLTVGDADTLWHPQFFSAVTCSALTMPEEERVWRIWQPPVLLMRNIFSVPAMTRNTAHATLIFELFGLAFPKWLSPAFAYSAYTLTMAMATHPEVDGWDVDVIAEDHHMFLKCYFAALWELANEAKESGGKALEDPVRVLPQVQVEPVYVPAVSYLVESSEGYWASVWARFDQARRHIQGVVELGYVLLQYVRLMNSAGARTIPCKTHLSILSIVWKIYVLMIQTNVQAWAVVAGVLTRIVPQVLLWLWNGGLASLADLPQRLSGGLGALDAISQLLFWVVTNISGFSIIYAFCASVVILGVVQGDYYACLPKAIRPAVNPMAEGEDELTSSSDDASPKAGRSPKQTVQDAACEEQQPPSFVQGPLSRLARVRLHLGVYLDTVGTGYTSMFLYGLVPLWMAAWSLIRRGTDFEYIVALKPE